MISVIKSSAYKQGVYQRIGYFLISSVSMFLVFASSTQAWTLGEPIIPCGGTMGVCSGGVCSNQPYNSCKDNNDCGKQAPCTKCELLHLVKNVIDFIMIAASPILATFFFVWAGVLLMLGGANPGMLSQGKRIFRDTFIGLLIVMMSWLITNTVVQTLKGPGGGNWWTITCNQIGL